MDLDIFSEEDQIYKINLLKKAEMIINLGTTLVIEASQLNKNICQIKVDKNLYPNVYRACNNSHVLRYLNSNKDIVDMCKYDIENIRNLLDYPNKFSRQIKNGHFTEIIKRAFQI